MPRSSLSSERASDIAHISRLLTVDEVDQVAGGNFNRAGTYAGGLAQPGFKNPTVIYDDGINVLTTDPSTSNIVYDSPFTPIRPL